VLLAAADFGRPVLPDRGDFIRLDAFGAVVENLDRLVLLGMDEKVFLAIVVLERQLIAPLALVGVGAHHCFGFIPRQSIRRLLLRVRHNARHHRPVRVAV
jgi:hypothetical protein